MRRAARRASVADQHRYFAATGRYTTDLVELGYTARDGKLVSRNGHYRVGARVCPERDVTECVIVIAEAHGAQAKDGALSLDSRGIRSPPHKW